MNKGSKALCGSIPPSGSVWFPVLRACVQCYCLVFLELRTVYLHTASFPAFLGVSSWK